MKKIFIVLFVIFGLIILNGCKDEEKKLPSEWALHYVIEDANSRFNNPDIIAYQIEEYKPIDDAFIYDIKVGTFGIYQITLLNDFGQNVTYNVLVAFNRKIDERYMWFSKRAFSEDEIIDIDMEYLGE
jgi:hypothetical protein